MKRLCPVTRSCRAPLAQEVRESEERFRNMADASPVMIWVSGPDKLCTFFSKGWLEFTGRTLDQEMGNGWAESVSSRGPGPLLGHLFILIRCAQPLPDGIPSAESRWRVPLGPG